jgi:hypothetical protein
MVKPFTPFSAKTMATIPDGCPVQIYVTPVTRLDGEQKHKNRFNYTTILCKKIQQ